MLEGKSVAVVVPAYDEEKLIATTLAGIPDFVDRIYVVDDASRDGTAEAARSAGGRVELIEHEKNQGVGAAILTGYKRALADGMDVTAVMAGDNQMDPDDLEAIATPVVRGEVDYAKANRLFTGRAWELIPRTRYLGNAVLSLLTKIASGYWHIADSLVALVRDHLDARVAERARALRGSVRRAVVDDVDAVDETGDPAERRADQLLLAVCGHDDCHGLSLEHQSRNRTRSRTNIALKPSRHVIFLPSPRPRGA